MRVKSPYMARGPGELTAPGGAMVFLFGKEDRDGMATVIYDGQVRRTGSQLWIFAFQWDIFFQRFNTGESDERSLFSLCFREDFCQCRCSNRPTSKSPKEKRKM